MRLLKGIPLQACDVAGELTTPTGAAIVSTVADEFGQLPGLVLEKIGWGAGTKEWNTAALQKIRRGARHELLGRGQDPAPPPGRRVGRGLDCQVLGIRPMRYLDNR